MANTVLDHEVEYIVAQLTAGKAVQLETDERDGYVTGITGIESGTEYARWVATRAERRASTHNS